MTTLQAAIATAIREELDHQGGTLLTLGRPLGMSKSAVSVRLTGQRPWRVDEFVIVAAVLGVSADTLLADARKIYRQNTRTLPTPTPSQGE